MDLPPAALIVGPWGLDVDGMGAFRPRRDAEGHGLAGSDLCLLDARPHKQNSYTDTHTPSSSEL